MSSSVKAAAPRDGRMCHSQTVSETRVQNLANQTDLSAQGQPALSKGFCSLPGSIIHWKWPFVHVTYVSLCQCLHQSLHVRLHLCVLNWIKCFSQHSSSSTLYFYDLFKVHPWFWTGVSGWLFTFEWNASEFMNEGLITDQTVLWGT